MTDESFCSIYVYNVRVLNEFVHEVGTSMVVRWLLLTGINRKYVILNIWEENYSSSASKQKYYLKYYLYQQLAC